MILNLHFDNIMENTFYNDGVYIMLDPNCTYQVAVRHLHIGLSANQITKDNDLWCLSTNLIDRSPTNEYQALSYFTLNRGKINHDCTPTSVLFYPLETHQLENPQFLFQRISKEKKINIDQVFVQLEIKKCLDSVNH